MSARSNRCPVAALLSAVMWATAIDAWAQQMNGFLPEKGDTDIALSATAETYDQFWMGDTKVSAPPVGEVDTTSTALWARYGILDNLAMIMNASYVDVDTDGTEGFSDSGLQDLTLLLDYRFFQSAQRHHSGLIAAGVRTPMSDYATDAPSSLGDHTTDCLMSLIYHYQGHALYFSQLVGYEVRDGDAPNGAYAYTELGRNLGPVTLAVFNSIYQAESGSDIGEPDFTFPGNQEDRWKGGAKVYSPVGANAGLSLSGWTTFDGRNTGESTGASLSMVLRL